MRISTELDGEQQVVEIRGDVAVVDGREYTIEFSEPERGVILLRSGGRVFEAVVSGDAKSREKLTVSIGGRSHEVTVTDPKRLRSSGAAHDHGDGRAEIKSAMPGKVVRILVELDAEVRKGDGVIVVEAMKMQNELKSPKDGKLVQIKASEGQTVNAGEVLLVVE